MYTLRGTPRQGLAGATLGFFIGFAAVSLFGPTVTYLRESAGLTPLLAGLLISIPNLSGSLLRIPFSAMVDSAGGRKPFIILLALSTVGLLGIFIIIWRYSAYVTDIFPILLFFGILAGCGIATFSVGIGQTSYWFPLSRQGSALGTFAGVGNLAPGIFAWLLSGVTIPLFGLTGSYLAWLVFLTVGLVVYLLVGRDAWFFQLVRQGTPREEAVKIARERYGQELFPKRNMKESLRVSAGVWQTWGLVFIYFTTFGGFIALTGWFPTYWVQNFGLTLGTAGFLTALYSVSASLFRVAGGGISDRFGGENTLSLALLVTTAGAVLMGFSASVGVSIAGVLVMALGMGVGNAAVFKLVPQEVPEAIGGAAGWVGGLGAFGGFVIPIVLAALILTGEPGDPGYARGFFIFVLLALASLGMVRILKSHRRVHGR